MSTLGRRVGIVRCLESSNLSLSVFLSLIPHRVLPMDLHDAWSKALKNTEIVRARVSALQTFQVTNVPYILLSESQINVGDTVVRRGEVMVDKPSLILPPNIPQLEGFEFKDEHSFDEQAMINFLLIRGISLPSLKYNNKTFNLDVFEGNLGRAVKHYQEELQRQENVASGLLIGPEDVWQLSLLIFICSQIARNTDSDIKKLIEDYKKREM
jgi:hypothetical protein